jgi:hypothetical protein
MILHIYPSNQKLSWMGENATVNNIQNTALVNNPNNSFQPERPVAKVSN